MWKYAAGPEPILLYKTGFTGSAPSEITGLAAKFLPPLHREMTCGRHFDAKNHRQTEPRFSLSWLRTCRGIYEEARPVIFASMTLHFCDSLMVSTFLKMVPESTIRLIRSLEFGLGVVVETDGRDGFSFAPPSQARQFQWGWEIHHRGLCLCPWCFFAGSMSLEGKFRALRYLDVVIYTTCKVGQGNDNNNAQQQTTPLRSGLVRIVSTDDPKNRPAMALLDGPDQWTEYVDILCGVRPLNFFARSNLGASLRSVRVDFCTDRIKHDQFNKCIYPRKCWCVGRRLDKDSLKRTGIAEELERRLMSGPGAE